MNRHGGAPTRPFAPVRDGRLFYWLAAAAAKRWVSVLLALYAFATDWVIQTRDTTFVTLGLLDEVAHLATALVILGALVRIRRAVPDQRFGWAMLTCSVLIDIDHLPLQFGSSVLTNGTPRPYTHALWTVLAGTVACAVARFLVARSGRPPPATVELILAGAAWGLAVHFFRDLPTGAMSFWWPISNVPVQVPYWWYVVALAVIIAVGPAKWRPRSADGTCDTTSPAASGAPESAPSHGARRSASRPPLQGYLYTVGYRQDSIL